ncbi:MAG: glucose-6-phosphate isomerase, partial [Henriciella sp.]
GLDPNRTLIVGISKSFGTEETLYNLARAREWLKASLGADWGQHLVLVTANIPRANSWVESDSGASPGDVLCLHLPESVGGRFSIWSAGSFSCL